MKDRKRKVRKSRKPLAAAFLALSALAAGPQARGAQWYVSPIGSDQAAGTYARPFASLARAQAAARKFTGKAPVTISLRAGVYYLPHTLVLTSADSGTKAAPVTYRAYKNEKVVVSGGQRLTLHWRPYRDGIMQATVPDDVTTDQLFVNGERQVLARYPNYDPKIPIFGGYAADAISPERVARWADPAGGYIHAMHPNLWGDFWYRITGKNAANALTYEGGWQNNRPAPMHPLYRYVENIFEELDAPGEWFLNTKTHTLYFYPPPGLDLKSATIEVPRLRTLIEFRGTESAPVRFVSLQGLTFRHTLRTFMDNKEPLLRSDWTIYRGGAVFFNGAEDCSLRDSHLDQLGGNAVFVNDYNRRVVVRGCHIDRAGANGVAFVGDPKAVRNPLFQYYQRQDYSRIDKMPGPQTSNYPSDCLVDDCLIHATGQFEKQTAPVEIDMAQDITVRHCSIYDVPRAGINIGDGCWGGHVIEFCDIFDTVQETGDHGSYNSWGRDRYWGLRGIDLNTAIANGHPDLPRLDAVKPIILRNNRWRCDHGWDIDLDDGSSNYHIYNNLCLNGGIKNREGFYRVVENNIMVNNTFCPHVWFADSGDVVRRNIIWGPYAPAGTMPPKPWGKEMDDNLVYRAGDVGTQPATMLQSQSGRDEHSIVADAMFVDPAHGDYRVKPGSPALALGFVNFPMDRFGVQKPELKAIARQPEMPVLVPPETGSGSPTNAIVSGAMFGAKVRNISGLGDRSAYGLPDESGVLVLEVPHGSAAQKSGLKPNDVIVAADGKAVRTMADLLGIAGATKGQTLHLTIIRAQQKTAADVAN